MVTMDNSEQEKVRKIVAARFDKSTREKIIAEVKRLHLEKMSDVVRRAVDEYFENHKAEIVGEK